MSWIDFFQGGWQDDLPPAPSSPEHWLHTGSCGLHPGPPRVGDPLVNSATWDTCRGGRGHGRGAAPFSGLPGEAIQGPVWPLLMGPEVDVLVPVQAGAPAALVQVENYLTDWISVLIAMLHAPATLCSVVSFHQMMPHKGKKRIKKVKLLLLRKS